jgi:hypothetical protein
MALSDKAEAARSQILQALLSGDQGTDALEDVPAMAAATLEDGCPRGELVSEAGGGAQMTLLPVLMPGTEQSSGTTGRY